MIFTSNIKVYFFTFSMRPARSCFESHAAPSTFEFETPVLFHHSPIISLLLSLFLSFSFFLFLSLSLSLSLFLSFYLKTFRNKLAQHGTVFQLDNFYSSFQEIPILSMGISTAAETVVLLLCFIIIIMHMLICSHIF